MNLEFVAKVANSSEGAGQDADGRGDIGREWGNPQCDQGGKANESPATRDAVGDARRTTGDEEDEDLPCQGNVGGDHQLARRHYGRADY